MTSNNDKASQAFEKAVEKGLSMNEKHIHICKATSKHHLWEHRDAQCQMNVYEGCVACPDHRPIPKHICLVSGNDVGTDTQQEGAEPDCYHCALAMLKARTPSGVASVAQSRDGVLDEAIAEASRVGIQEPLSLQADPYIRGSVDARQIIVNALIALRGESEPRAKHRKIQFGFDERSYESLESIERKLGYEVEEITVKDSTTGESRVLLVQRQPKEE